MSETIELTEEQVEQMNILLKSLGHVIQGEQKQLNDALNLMGSIGNGTLDQKLYELMNQKVINLQRQYETIEKYVNLWENIVNEFCDIESNLVQNFKEGSIR